MYKYYTRSFHFDAVEYIDKWLNSFIKDKPQSEYSFNIVGYVGIDNKIVITIIVFEFKE